MTNKKIFVKKNLKNLLINSNLILDGSNVDVSYFYTSNSVNSPYSPSVTFYCASLPDPPNVPQLLWKDNNRINVNWTPQSNGGSSILGYILYMKLSTESEFTIVYDGTNSREINHTTITSYKNSPLINSTYNIVVKARNIIGLSGNSAALNVIMDTYPKSSNCILSGIEKIYQGYVTKVTLKVN